MKRASRAWLVLGLAVLLALIFREPAWAQFKAQFGATDSTVYGNLTVTGTSTTTGADTAASYTATSSGQLNCSSTTATCKLQSSIADATTSSTVGAITLKSGADITAADLLLDVQDSAGAHAFTVTEAGTATALNALSVPSGATSSIQLINGGGVNFSLADNNAYIIRSSADTLRVGDGTSSGFRVGSIVATGTVVVGEIQGDASVRGTCTLDGATPSKCTATVTAAAICTCTPVGTTAAIALAGCAVSLSGTTLTLTGADLATTTMNYHCIL